VSVYDARFAKPVDRELIRNVLEQGIPILTLEDQSVVGGFGTAVIEAASEMGLDAGLVTRLGLPDRWVYQDSRAKQMTEIGMDVPGVVRSLRECASKAKSASSSKAALHAMAK
jgi:1-deoxy-D-xylulose-5-phosphate synthase